MEISHYLLDCASVEVVEEPCANVAVLKTLFIYDPCNPLKLLKT